MISVVIVGNGQVASHLIDVFIASKDIDLKQVYSRSTNSTDAIKSKVSIVHNLNELVEADVTILAVSDDAIAEVSKQITNKFVVHTSGTKPKDELQNSGTKGVFYPLQTFSKNKAVDLSKVPFCIEAPNESSYLLLENIVSSLNGNAFRIDSNQRKYLHLSAVFANNFSNHMIVLAKDICDSYQVPFEVLSPLIRETIDKALTMEPKEAQTGPAKRNDIKTIENQLVLLSGKQKEIYQLVTQSIQSYGKKL